MKSGSDPFFDMCRRVVGGDVGLATCDGVPVVTGASGESLSVLMHPELPGAVALAGVLGQRVFVSGFGSERLREACLEQHPEIFLESPQADRKEVLVCLVGAVVATLEGSLDEPFVLVPGGDALDLVRQILALYDAPGREVLH